MSARDADSAALRWSSTDDDFRNNLSIPIARSLSSPNISLSQQNASEGDGVARKGRRTSLDESEQLARPLKKFCAAATRHKVLALPQQASDSIQTIYMIQCKCAFARSHSALAYSDMPAPRYADPNSTADDTLVHFSGEDSIFDLKSFMEGTDTPQHQEIAVVVICHIQCKENQEHARNPDHPLRWHESVAIKSSRLRDIIREVAQCHYQPVGRFSNLYSIKFPPELAQYGILPERLFLYHHIDRLSAHLQQCPSDGQYLLPLLTFCHQRYGPDFQEAQDLFRSGMVNQKHIAKLFIPNTTVVEHYAASFRTFVVLDWPSFEESGNTEVSGWYWFYDGASLVRRSISTVLPSLKDSPVPIDSLSLYPLSFASESTLKTLEQRGRKYWSLKSASHVSYTGLDFSNDHYPLESRFIVDHQVYKKMHRGSQAGFFGSPEKMAHDRRPSKLNRDSDPEPEDYLIMPQTVHGFYLMEKQWIRLFVDNISDVKWNKSAFDRLVLDSNMKELVQALVTVRTAQKGVKHGLGRTGKRTDIIGGKGNGLIMLLHGGPGTGKTLTAESVAEIAEMPLYRVTCGDIGTTPDAVEEYLGLVMYLGVAWNCVLLLDEADVFLEERSMSDLARNSLVSIFLRVLEYYDGILILTSNRVGIFDDAFRSRIQVALHYENLNRTARKKIWSNFLEILEEDDEDADLPEIRLHLDKLAAIEMNGRQIRNIVTTARQLALYRKQRLDWPHFERALKVSTDFNTYLQRVHGHTEDQRARDDKLR